MEAPLQASRSSRNAYGSSSLFLSLQLNCTGCTCYTVRPRWKAHAAAVTRLYMTAYIRISSSSLEGDSVDFCLPHSVYHDFLRYHRSIQRNRTRICPSAGEDSVHAPPRRSLTRFNRQRSPALPSSLSFVTLPRPLTFRWPSNVSQISMSWKLT